MNSSTLLGGIFLILIGALLLADNMNFLYIDWYYWVSNFWRLWPLVLIVLAAVSLLSWIRHRRDSGQLFIGVMLMVYGFVFLYSNYYGWWRWGAENLWAFMMLGPGLGFLSLYAFAGREQGILVPGVILTFLGLLFLSGTHTFALLWPLGLIAVGLYLLRRGYRNQQKPVAGRR